MLQLYKLDKCRNNNSSNTLSEEDPTNNDIKAIQMVQNKMARLLNGKTLKDKIPTKTLLENAKLLSVNQINARIKLQEIWKILNIEEYPIRIELNNIHDNQVATRAMTKRTPVEQGNTNLLSKTSIISFNQTCSTFLIHKSC